MSYILHHCRPEPSTWQHIKESSTPRQYQTIP